MVKTTIITVCYNSSIYILDYIYSFLAVHKSSSYKKMVEFIFIDNSKEKKLFKNLLILRRSGFKIKLINSNNVGFSKACNLGVANSKGENIIFINPDVVFLTPIDKVISELKSKPWGTCYVKSKLSFQSLSLLPEKKNLFLEFIKVHRIFYLIPKIFLSKFNFILNNSFITGSFFAIKKKIFINVGGFNKNFFLYFEDVELSERLRKRYGNPFINMDVIIEHHSHKSSKSYRNLCKLEAEGFKTYLKISKKKFLLKKFLYIFCLLSKIYPKYKIRYLAYSKIKLP